MSTVYLLKYNNYYNRQVRRPLTNNDIPTYEDFINSGAVWLATYENINFKLGNRINQEIILNYDIQAHDEPDYCIVVEDDGSRTLWFILEIERTRKGQAKFALYRDLMNTYYNKIRSMKAFIEKGFVPSDNNLIFNSENMTYNQIKTDEHLICDKSGCPWLVGYFAENTPAIEGSFSLSANNDTVVTKDHTDWEYYKYASTPGKQFKYIQNVKFNSSFYQEAQRSTYNYTRTVGIVVDSEVKVSATTDNTGYFIGNVASKGSWDNMIKKVTNTTSGTGLNFDDISNHIVTKCDNTEIKDILDNFNGKNVYFNDGVYNISLNQIKSTEEKITYENTSDRTTDAYLYTKNRISSILASAGANVTLSNDGKIVINYLVYEYVLSMKKVADTAGEYTYSFPSSPRQLEDSPYKMFAIPFPVTEYNDAMQVYVAGSDPKVPPTKKLTEWIYSNLSMAWVSNIAKKLNSNLYDVQVLPYCPIINYVKCSYSYKNKYMNLAIPIDYEEGKDYMLLKNKSGVAKNICFFPLHSTFSFTQQYFIFESDATNYKSVEEKLPLYDDLKIQSETQSCRLVSPNFNGSFEFNIAKNGGVEYFNIDCTYKPFNPYIQVQPNFGRLYGRDFNDARGLILNGDFSIPIVNDKWIEYELQNKNYQNMFNRQIENMEVNNNIAQQETKWGIASGVVQGTAQGAMAGAMAGGGWGAVAGAAIGAGASALGGAQDYNNLLKRQQETIDYTRDQFGYQLGNIKALPYNLTKVSSLNAISKYFPLVEVYECSDIEKEALKEKIKYNGMTVGMIGYIEDYLSNSGETYIKAKPIRFDEDNLLWDIDYHEAIVLAEELNKGVYM